MRYHAERNRDARQARTVTGALEVAGLAAFYLALTLAFCVAVLLGGSSL
jgi:hypothetical protein